MVYMKARNKQKYKDRNKMWQKANPEKVAKYSRFYLWLREQATPLWYEEDLVKTNLYKTEGVV